MPCTQEAAQIQRMANIRALNGTLLIIVPPVVSFVGFATYW